MLHYFLTFLVLVHGDLQSLWADSGCSSDGLLSPKHVPYFWRTISNENQFINDLKTKAQAGDRMSSLSCLGTANESEMNSYTNKFHLLWECPDSTNCKLPPVHALCVRTLRKLHPKAEIKLWSRTLDDYIVSHQLNDLNIQVSRYDDSFFEGLPEATQKAVVDIRSFMNNNENDHAHENSFSHWSDLFRAAVLYKEGGVYTDLDSIWLRPITEASPATNWIPRTPAWQDLQNKDDTVTQEGKNYFLEGGIMRFDKPNSPFLKLYLENFPKYNEEMATCWACVGPRQLTRTFNQLQNERDLPMLIDSTQVFGVRHYRNFFPNMFNEFDPMIWAEILNSNVVATHLFTASPQGGINKESTIHHLFKVGGVDEVTKISASWRKSKKRRNLLSSLYYLDDGSAQLGESESQVLVFSADYAIAVEDEQKFLEACTDAIPAICAQVYPGSTKVRIDGTKSQIHATKQKMQNEKVLDLSEAGFAPLTYVKSEAASDATIGSGSVLYWYGSEEPVKATVTFNGTATKEHIDEVRQIFMSAFGVPLSAVHTEKNGENEVLVTISEVNPESASEQADEAKELVSSSEALPSGTSVSSVDLPTIGYTEAILSLSYECTTETDYNDGTVQLYNTVKNVFSTKSIITNSEFTVRGNVHCFTASSVTGDELTNAYEHTLTGEFGAKTDFDEGVYTVTFSSWHKAREAYEYANKNSISELKSSSNKRVSVSCDIFDADLITQSSSTNVQKTGVTQTEMKNLANQARAELEEHGFVFQDLAVQTVGTQAIDSCKLLTECKTDYAALSTLILGDNIKAVELADTVELAWWWSYQLGKKLEKLVENFDAVDDVENLRVVDGFFAYKYGDLYVNTCVQHSSQWAEKCDNSIGICAGGSGGINYGFASQQAKALGLALESPSFQHPDCPYGCKALTNEDQKTALGQVISNKDDVDALCVQNGRYWYWTDPLHIVDTCVAFSADFEKKCALSDYSFCSAINYDKGHVIFGDFNAQGHSLKHALSQDRFRHSQCE